MGEKWFKALQKNKAPYFIRMKENTLIPWGDDQTIQIKMLFQHLKGSQNRLVEKEMYGLQFILQEPQAVLGSWLL